MDTKKLILAIALSIIVITLYQYLFMPKPQPKTTIPVNSSEMIEEKPVVSTDDKDGEKSKSLSDIFSRTRKVEKAVVPLIEAITTDISGDVEKDIVVNTNLYTAVFTNRGGGLKSFILPKSTIVSFLIRT